jgi:hypothetical protein
MALVRVFFISLSMASFLLALLGRWQLTGNAGAAAC